MELHESMILFTVLLSISYQERWKMKSFKLSFVQI